MKNMIAVYRNIKALVKHHCFLFIVVISGILLSTIGILFYSGYFLYSYYETTGLNRNNLSIQLQAETQPQAVSEILHELTSAGTDQVLQLTAYDKLNPHKNSLSSSSDSAQDLPAIGVYRPDYAKSLLLGRFFTPQEDDPHIVLSEFSTDVLGYSQSPVGSSIQIGDTAFKVIGMISHSYENGYLIPIHYYINHFKTLLIDITWLPDMSRSQLNDIRETILQNSHVLSCEITTPPGPFLSPDFLLSFLQIILIFCAALINIVSLLYFWNRLSWRKYQIYSVCGSRPGQKASIILMQTLALMVPGIAAGFLLFLALLPVLGRLHLVYAAQVENYCLIAAVLLLIVTGISVLIAWRSAKENQIYRAKE